jgi:two-component system, NtrC family, response regulator AtoC
MKNSATMNTESRPVVESVHAALSRVADSDCPLLILGEPGVGKRWLARQLHARSHRCLCTYTEVACAGLGPETLLSALSSRGTLCLVEVADLAPPLEKILLESYFHGNQPQTCCLIGTSCRESFLEPGASRLGEELQHAFSAITLHVPPLRFRKHEILAFADELIVHYAHQFDRPKPTLCAEVIEYLTAHCWPGNFVELRTAIKTIVAIDDQAISFAALKAAPARRSINGHLPVSLKEASRAASSQIERQLICEVLTTNGGNRKRAAVQLGISYKALLYKLKQIDLSAACGATE